MPKELIKNQTREDNLPYVLIVEDEQFLCELMVVKLEKSGLEVHGVFDGETAFLEIEKRPPDIILLDILLPGMDGFEILRRLKADSRFKNIPVIIISNLAEPQDITRAINEGAEEYFVKAEHSPDEIVQSVKQHLKARA